MVRFDPVVVVAVALASIRVLAWLSVVPPFSAAYVPRPVRIGAALAIGVAVEPRIPLTTMPSFDGLIVDAVGQVVIGVGFGALVMILLSAFGSAGDSLDLFGGLVLPQSLEPIGFRGTNAAGQLYTIVTFALLVVTGGDLLLIRGLLTTFDVVGPTVSSLTPMANGAIQATSTMFTATFEIVAPLLAVEFLVQVALAMMAKAAPTVNIFLFAFSLQVLVLILIMAFGMAILPSAVHRIVDHALSLEGGLL